jgi:hypothetical protein
MRIQGACPFRRRLLSDGKLNGPPVVQIFTPGGTLCLGDHIIVDFHLAMASTVRFIFRVPRSSILGLYLVLQQLYHLEDSHHGASGRRAWSWSLINVSILRNTNPPSVRLDTVKCVHCGTEVADRKVKSSSIGFDIGLAEYQRQISLRIEIDT